jgi:predicted transcriptional regulator
MRTKGFESGSGFAATVVRIPVGASQRANFCERMRCGRRDSNQGAASPRPWFESLSEQFSDVVSDCARRFIIVAAAGFGMDGLTDTRQRGDR